MVQKAIMRDEGLTNNRSRYNIINEERTTHITYKKLAVRWLNEALSFVSSLVVADSLVLRNHQLIVAANR